VDVITTQETFGWDIFIAETLSLDRGTHVQEKSCEQVRKYLAVDKRLSMIIVLVELNYLNVLMY
jgi:hypothetical protein